jgi:hypothetical protein
VAGVEHAKEANEEDVRGDNRMAEKTYENGKRLNEGKEHMRAPFACPIRMRTDLPQQAYAFLFHESNAKLTMDEIQ